MHRSAHIRRAILTVALVALCLVPGKASALTFVGDVDISSIFGPTGHSAEGLGFDPASGNLYAVTSIGPKDKSVVYELTTTGSLINSYHVTLDRVKGVTFLPNGNMLLSNSAPASAGGGLFEYTKGGVAVPGGINLTIDPISQDNDGVYYNAGTNTIFVADDDTESIYEFSTTGSLLNTVSTKQFDTKFNDPEGIAVDPVTGNLYVADASKGTKAFYELSPTGALISKFDFLANGYLDPEGIAIDAANGLVYVSDDNAQKILIFDTGHKLPGPGGNHAAMPEPATAAMGMMGLAGLAAALRRRRLA